MEDDDLINKRTGNIKPPQLETLISFMENHPNLAVGKKDNLSPEKRKALWNDLYFQLNAVVGGTRKNLDQWKKSWNDQKAKTHAKAMKLIETGGNSTYLTHLEERILKILSSTNEFKSPQPSSDIFLIPETGIVFSLPIVAQDASQSSVSNAPSTSQEAPDAPLCDPLMSETSNISATEGLPNVAVAVSSEEISLTDDRHTLMNYKPLPEADTPVVTLSSDIPSIIIQETQAKRNLITETTKSVTECSVEDIKSVTNYPAEISESINNPSSTTVCNPSIAAFGKDRRRRRNHKRSHYMTADKAAETFGYISQRNCAVLERIASAMEAQANRAAKQTQLMREIIDVVKQR
ncbi:uncharacterized protein [Parasteatoda tepidariorum]|uniref:uncharacterized protein n=1 Tax=Parasteatoda tepidariorum TaxID=114398 RepID=UPI00077F98DB|nr:uncharacterized protein LOC107453309 [Parasteatoda tepidariorum]